jgi:tetraacyldisaccharide 4'-kinase
MRNKLHLLLLPFSFIYGLVTLTRNLLYNWGVFKTTSFNLPIICVGNLVLGGAGKTPTTEYLVRLLADKKIAILSRGYGRKTNGYILADENATALTIGDEPMQYYQKFANVTVAVCENRVKGINILKQNHDIILLDDAYQHRSVKAGFNILLFEFDKLKKRQFLLPAGNLREYFFGYNRANAILITKCPNPINELEQSAISQKFNLKPEQTISFSSIKYGQLTHLFNKEIKENLTETTLFLITGIANPVPLKKHLKGFNQVIYHHQYPDHHLFSRQNIAALVTAFNQDKAKQKIIITTEKDSKRLLDDNLKDLLLNLPIFYLPMAIELATNNKLTFDTKILEYVRNTKRCH